VLFKLNPYAKKLRRQELRKLTSMVIFIMRLMYSSSQAKPEEGRFRQGQEARQGCWQDLLDHPPCALSGCIDLVYVSLDASEVWSMYALCGSLSVTIPTSCKLSSRNSLLLRKAGLNIPTRRLNIT
jgi:hypothetical protein